MLAREKGISKVKFQERILNESNSILRTDVSNPHLQFVSFTKAELNDDFSVCKLGWDTFDKNKRGDIKDAIEGIQGLLRSKLAKILKVRHVPEIKFFYDSQFEDELHITNLLEEEKNSSS